MTHSTWIYIIIMILTTNLIRVIPLTLIRGKITNRFVRSFLYYVPYVTLAVMTFPAIIEATNSPVAGAVALILGIIAAVGVLLAAFRHRRAAPRHKGAPEADLAVKAMDAFAAVEDRIGEFRIGEQRAGEVDCIDQLVFNEISDLLLL